MEGELSLEERQELESADGTFLRKTAKFHTSIAEVAELAEMRRVNGIPPSH